MTWQDFIPYSGLFGCLLLIEWLLSSKMKWSNYDWKETLTSIACKYMRMGAVSLYAVWFGPLFAWCYQNRIYTHNLSEAWEFALTFVLSEFIYYTYHRFCHEYPLGWASHATHHTITKMNITASGRVEITTPFSLFYFTVAPLFMLGVNPWILGAHSAGLLVYQQFIHTELIPKIKFLDAFLNTPSNHRVHHGTQSIYLNKNYGGITIVFDRLFGTYQAELESEKPIYGLAGGFRSYNPLRIGFIGWEIWLRHLWYKYKTRPQGPTSEVSLDLEQTVGQVH